MWNDGGMITSSNIDKWNVQHWLWSSTQHNIFTESIGYAVAIETMHILRCVWKTSHTHTDTQSHCIHRLTYNTNRLSILEHGVQLFVLFIYLFT